MSFTRQNDHYAVRLAGDLLNCCENKTADFLNPASFPYYTQDMFTKRVLTDAGQLQTLLNNAAHGSQYINYAPTYIIQDSKKEWMENIKENDREIGCIIYKGKDENGNKHYEMMTPAKKYNPGGIDESPMTQNPVPNVGICRLPPNLDPGNPKNIEKYITDVIGNYFNAAFTKTPYYPPQWGGQETEMLSKALNADPSIAIRTAQQAFAQATSVKMENTANQELNNNVKEAMKQGLPPFNTKKQEAIIGPVNINGNGVPLNGIDFINSYYNSINGKNGRVKSNTAAAQNGYIPYQTHNENLKNIDKFLVEQYGNIMNASLTGTPYSGSISPARLKTLSSRIEAKMENDPAYMSGIVNQAHQNVLGFNYMPYDKDDFITKARDPSSKEFKLLNQTIASHVNDILRKNKTSFNGQFQELSRELTEKLKNIEKEVKKPSTRTTAARASTAKKAETPSSAASTAEEVKKPSTRANTTRTSTANKAENSSVSVDAPKKEERPSFVREVSEFVKKNIVEKKPALVLVDTFLGTVIDKAKKIVRTGKTIAAAVVIATNVVAPNFQGTIADHLSKIPPVNSVSISVNQNDFKSTVQGTGQVRQNQQVKTAARK